MRMLRRYLRIELDEIDRQDIKFQTIGRIGALAENVRKEIQRATEQTARNKGMILTRRTELRRPRGDCRRCACGSQAIAGRRQPSR